MSTYFGANSPSQIDLLQVLVSQFFGEFAVTSSEIPQPLLKPRLFGPIPILRGEQISVVQAVVYFTL